MEISVKNIKHDALSINKYNYNHVAQVCGGMAAGLGVAAIMGWISGFLLLTSICFDCVPMGQNTSIAFVALGCALFILAYHSTHPVAHQFIKIVVIFDLLFAILIIIQYFSGINFGINQVLFSTPEKTSGMVPISMMSFMTAVIFLLIGISLLLLSFPLGSERRCKGAASILATMVVVIGSTVILGYSYATPLFYWARRVPMPLTTAIAFVLMGIGLISSAGPQYWPLYLVVGSSTRSRLMRVFLILVGAVVLFDFWLDAIVILHLGRNPAFVSSLLAILTLVVSNFIISHIANKIGNPIDRIGVEHKLVTERFQKLSGTIEQSPNAVMITDIKGNIEYVNSKFVQITGYSREVVVGQNPRILKSGQTPPEEYKRLWEIITAGGEWQGEFYNKKKTGGLYWEHAYISPIRNSEGVITHFLAVKEDITERKRAESQLVYMANRDPLTNLYNRRYFQKDLEHWLTHVQRYKIHGALLFVDLDNFKNINDTFGHQTGDKLLKTVASLLRKRIRRTDTLARLGGDEFAIILHRTNLEQAQSVAREIIELIRRSAATEENESFSITVSIGIALFPEHGATTETLLSSADIALYRAKEEGRNRLCIYTPDQKT